MRAIGLGAAFALAASCVFEQGTPPQAVILCTVDADCPVELRCSRRDAVCAPADAVAPRLVSFSLPSEAKADTHVELSITASDALGPAPRLAWLEADPGFGTAAVDGPTAVFALDVDAEAPPDGFYVLGSVTLESAGGLRSVVPVDAALHVDRAAPRIDARVLTSDPRAFSDVENTVIAVRFSASERLGAVAIDLAGVDVATTCSFDSGATGTGGLCSTTLLFGSAGTSEGELVLQATDLAGNQGVARLPVEMDFVAPGITAVLVTITGPGGEVEGSASVGSTVALEIVVDEPLASLPLVAIDDGPTATVGAASVRARPDNALVFDASFVVESVPEDALAVVSVTLSDLVGHTTAIDAAHTVAIRAARDSGCAIPAGVQCIDADADGVTSRACGGADCDDTDPLTRPGAVEIPGDGRRNDCAAALGDLGLDDAAGAYVDSLAGADDVDCGTRDSPCASIAAAIPRAVSSGGGLLLLRSGGSYNLTGEAAALGVVGGLLRDGGAWSRPASPAAAAPSLLLDDSIAYGGSLLEGLRTAARLQAATGSGVLTISRCRFDDNANGHGLARQSLLVDVDIDNELNISGNGTRVVTTRSGETFLRRGVTVEAALVVFARVQIGDRVDVRGSLQMFSSSVNNGRVACFPCSIGGLAVVGSTLSGDSQPIYSYYGGQRILDNVIAVTTQADVVAFAPDAIFSGNLLAAPNGSTVTVYDEATYSFSAGVSAFEAAAPELRSGNGNGTVVVGTGGDLVTGSDRLAAIPLAGPEAAMTVWDRFGTCRAPVDIDLDGIPDGLLVGADSTP